MNRAPIRNLISRKQAEIATRAKQMPNTALRTLAHHIDCDWLREAYRQTRKNGAPGIDGVTAEEYAQDLEGNLRALHQRLRSGTYRAPPVKRVHIPKDNNKTRPIGIPTFEDKIVQRAAVMLLEPIYEQDFYAFSYGFRPHKSPHDAVSALREGLMEMKGGWVLDVDVRSFFDDIDHQQLRDLLRLRIADRGIQRLVGKWLRAGVLDDGVLQCAEAGTPQGGVISPLLANIYLHEVLDRWWVEEVQPRLKGKSALVRFADDFVMAFAEKSDAERVLATLAKRFARFGLTLHPEKTRLVRFTRPSLWGEASPRPGSFDFLGFTHYWAKSLRGNWVILRKTSSARLSRGLRRLNEWLKRHRHRPLAWQARLLASKLRGHFNYYGIRGNSRSLGLFRTEAIRLWKTWLGRRSQRGLTWKKFNRWLRTFPLPRPRLRRIHRQQQLVNLWR